MGYINKLYHRSNKLSDGPNKDKLYLDLMENVHIHYRDFRLEFGVDEFFEFVNTLNIQADELKKFVERTNYKEDIILNNYDEKNNLFCKNMILKNKRNYFNNRISLEKNIGGFYHLHYRNLKIEMNENDFRLLQKSLNENNNKFFNFFKKEDINQIIELLEANELIVKIIKKEQNYLKLKINKNNKNKIKKILNSIKFKEINNSIFKKNNLKIEIVDIETIVINNKIYYVKDFFYKTKGSFPKYYYNQEIKTNENNNIKYWRKFYLVSKDLSFQELMFVKEYKIKCDSKFMKKYVGINKKEEVIDEVNNLKKLSHKNTIKIYDYDSNYILMEYIEHTLSEYIQKFKPTKYIRLKIFDQIMDYLLFLKNKGISINEWNIDPQNILFDEKNMQLKFVDFEICSENQFREAIGWILNVLELEHITLERKTPDPKINKELYSNEIIDLILNDVEEYIINNIYDPETMESIYIIKSILNYNFGIKDKIAPLIKYYGDDEFYNKNFYLLGSDIDLVILLKKDAVINTNSWIKKNSGNLGCDVFIVDKIDSIVKKYVNFVYEFNNIIFHPIEAFIYRNSKKDYINELIERIPSKKII